MYISSYIVGKIVGKSCFISLYFTSIEKKNFFGWHFTKAHHKPFQY